MKIADDNSREMLKRAEELAARCEAQAVVTATKFLTPAEQYELAELARRRKWDNLYFFGGQPDCERKIGFFLPFYMEKEDFQADEYICAIAVQTRFAQPSHRDYLGSLMGLGIERSFVGDIRVQGERGCFFCLPALLPPSDGFSDIFLSDFGFAAEALG